VLASERIWDQNIGHRGNPGDTMFYFLALIPATMLTVAGYFVIYLSLRSEGALRTFGRYLGYWAFSLAVLVILAGIFGAAHHHHRGMMMHEGMMSGHGMPGSGPPSSASPAPAPGNPPAGGASPPPQ